MTEPSNTSSSGSDSTGTAAGTAPSTPDFADAPLRLLEDDENVPPRPEEELADIERSEPDPH